MKIMQKKMMITSKISNEFQLHVLPLACNQFWFSFFFFFFGGVLTPKLVECEGSLNWVHVSHPDWLEIGKETVDG